jgi:predicted metalloendopeptidase
MTDGEVFFLSRLDSLSDDALRDQIAMNVHAPPAVRTNAPLRDVDAWYTAFGVLASDKNYLPPAQRVHIW